jgi:hypothetical protein
MKIFGLEIRRVGPNWRRQRDLFFRCPKCGAFVKCGRLENGDTILTALYGVDKIDRIELEHDCGGMIFLASAEFAEETAGPVDWKKAVETAIREVL